MFTRATDANSADELKACVARCGVEKYRRVGPMGVGAKVAGFVANLLQDDDEEDVVERAVPKE